MNPLWIFGALREAYLRLTWQHARYMVRLGREYKRLCKLRGIP